MSISRQTLAKYLKSGDVFVETGTRWGLTVLKALEIGVKVVHTIEVDPAMADTARRIIVDAYPQDAWKVHLYTGDSTCVLKSLICELNEPAIFFLDAHDASSPLPGELSVIVYHKAHAQDTILIDDVRIIKSGQWGFTLEKVLELLKQINPNYKISYEDGVVPEDILVARS